MLENVAEFLTALTYHNDRDWFMAHKSEYMEAKAEFDSFVERLILAVASFDPTVGLPEAKDCCYRIYRDVRFSWDKSPYKTWMGAYICRGGRKSGYAGYYFHFQPVSGGSLLDGSMLAAGLYRPSSAMLGKIRRGIYSHGRAFHTAVMRADGFSLDPDRRLQRVPPGFPKDFRYSEYLKCRDYCLQKYFSAGSVSFDGITSAFASTCGFVKMLNSFLE